MLEDRVKYLEEKLDKEIEYSKVMVKRIIGFMTKEQEEKDAEEEASKKKKEASYHSKKGETTKDMVAGSSDGGQGAPRMSRLGGSSPPRALQGLSLHLHIYLLFFMCN
jgi:hypothetical protein